MVDFIRESLGRAFIASAMRRVSDQFFVGSSEWHREFGIAAPVRTWAQLLLLEQRGPLGITEIASELRQSHPTIIEWSRALSDLRMTSASQGAKDRRRNVISLTATGKKEASLILEAQGILADAYAELCAEVGADIFEPLLRLELACQSQPMLERLRERANLRSD